MRPALGSGVAFSSLGACYFMAELIDDFDWDNVGANGFGGNYNADQRAELEKMYGDTLTTVRRKRLLKAPW
jgi:hypothetical protein